MNISHPTSSSVICPAQLTKREQDVLQLLIEGQSNAEIASHLHLSINTVKTHIKGIMNKFGVDHRVQVAVFALRHELVS